MSRGRWMTGERFCIANVYQPNDQLKRIVKGFAGLKPALDPKSEQRGRAPIQVLLNERIVRAFGEPGIVDPGDARVFAQEICNFARVFDVALDPQCYSLDALQKQERIKWRQHRSHGSLVNTAGALDVGLGPETLSIDQPVIRRIWIIEGWETACMLRPWEAAAVNDRATERRTVTTKEFGQRMNRDVRSVLEGLQNDRGCDRVVNDKRHAVAMCNLCQRLDVANITCRVADGFCKHRLGVFVDQLFDRVRLVALGKTAGNA